MQTINRLLSNICSQDLQKSKHFYQSLFDFEVTFESDWFIHLRSATSGSQLGIIDKYNALVPFEFRGRPNGNYLTFVVDNVDELHTILQDQDVKIEQAPEDTFYGQRRMLITDPDGTLIDVSSLI